MSSSSKLSEEHYHFLLDSLHFIDHVREEVDRLMMADETEEQESCAIELLRYLRQVQDCVTIVLSENDTSEENNTENQEKSN